MVIAGVWCLVTMDLFRNGQELFSGRFPIAGAGGGWWSFYLWKMQKVGFVWDFCGSYVGVIPFLMKNAWERIFESNMQIFQSRDKRKMPNFEDGNVKSRVEIGQALTPLLSQGTTKGWKKITLLNGNTLALIPCNRCANIGIFWMRQEICAFSSIFSVKVGWIGVNNMPKAPLRVVGNVAFNR